MIKCDECKKECSTHRNLLKHKNRIHNPDYRPPLPVKCYHCGGMFANLSQHIKFRHPQNDNDKEQVNRIRKKQKEYYKDNSTVCKLRSKLWDENNKERSKQLKRDWATANRKPTELTTYNNERIKCDKCGFHIIRYNLLRHRNGKRCINKQEKIIDPIQFHKEEVERIKIKIEDAKLNGKIKNNLGIKQNIILNF